MGNFRIEINLQGVWKRIVGRESIYFLLYYFRGSIPCDSEYMFYLTFAEESKWMTLPPIVPPVAFCFLTTIDRARVQLSKSVLIFKNGQKIKVLKLFEV